MYSLFGLSFLQPETLETIPFGMTCLSVICQSINHWWVLPKAFRAAIQSMKYKQKNSNSMDQSMLTQLGMPFVHIFVHVCLCGVAVTPTLFAKYNTIICTVFANSHKTHKKKPKQNKIIKTTKQS